MPVGTRGAVRTLDAADLEAVGAQVVLGNTYHLMLRPGADVVADLGGLHRFTGWSGHLLTDSGGYQIFSLGPHGRRGRRHVRVDLRRQRPAAHARSRRWTSRPGSAPTSRWRSTSARPCRPPATWWRRRPSGRIVGPNGPGGRSSPTAACPRHQVQFGIVQGGIDEGLRARSAAHARRPGLRRLRHRRVVGGGDQGRDGPGAGRRHRRAAGRAAPLPDGGGRSRPGSWRRWRSGVDLFDCVLPTRLARHGTVLTERRPAQPPQRPLRPRRRPARSRRAVPAARALLARLPPPPARRPRAERPAADHPAEPVVAAAPGRAGPRRDPRRHLRGSVRRQVLDVWGG